MSTKTESFKEQAALKAAAFDRRRLADHAAAWVVTLGGIGIILCIIAILLFISLEVYPLWKGAKAELTKSLNLRENSAVSPLFTGGPDTKPEFPIVAVGIEEYQKIGYFITTTGSVNFISLEDGKVLNQIQLAALGGSKQTESEEPAGEESGAAEQTGDEQAASGKPSGSAESGQASAEQKQTEPEKPTGSESAPADQTGDERAASEKPTGSIESEQASPEPKAEAEKSTEEIEEEAKQMTTVPAETEQTGIVKPTDRKITSAAGSLDNKKYVLGTSDGYIIPLEFGFNITYDEEGQRAIKPELKEGDPIKVADLPITHVAYKSDEGNMGVAVVTSDGKLLFVLQETTTSLDGEESKEEFKYDLTEKLGKSAITAIELDDFFENLYVGTKEGTIYHWDIRDKANPNFLETIDATPNRNVSVSALGFLIGGRSIIVGDEAGGVSTWFQVEDKTSPSGRKLKQAHILGSHKSQVTAVAASPRDRGLLSADIKGNIILHYSTSDRKLLEINSDGSPIKELAFAPKANGAVALSEKGTLFDWKLDNPHPEANLKSIFGKIWYEGYKKPEYVWQSTGGSDDFEPKFSLTPLVYGTFKGTFYAMLIAIPLAILGAICVSQFMHPSIKSSIKPIVEIMAALPSVVLGFLAGLWLAPLIEKMVPAVFMMPIVITLMILITVFLWRFTPRTFRGKFKEGTELIFLIPVCILGILICIWLNDPVEALFLGGDVKNWLYNVFGLQYDQRNSLVVGFAMGFAVIPIIFTISEDALSNVPRHLISGSLALGATKWQTAIQVVLPTASAGIFSAIMIGLGRAVGETMIVLMATGNTPIMDWSMFNGFRALSANIAVEIPEAPEGGTLYRVLFLAALLLFAVTFVVNTAAEMVRMRLRKKYGQL